MSSTEQPLSEEELFNSYPPKLKQALKIIITVQCAAWKTGHINSTLLATVVFLFWAVYFSIFPLKAKEYRRQKLSNPSVDTIRTAWAVGEGPLRGITKLSTPKINIYPIKICNDAIPAYIIADDLSSSESKRGFILHFHGGGMISNSPRSDFASLARMSKRLKVPVVSVDYRLAPEHKYPAGLDDCYEAYKWLLSRGHEYGLSTDKIVLTGDSAGGYYAITTVFKSIQDDNRVPNAVMLVYPSVIRISGKYLSHRRFKNDIILPESFRDAIINNYYDHTLHDPLSIWLSPINAPIELFSKFPPTHIFVGDADPLLDDSTEFYNKLKSHSDKPTEITIYPGLCHGVLNLTEMHHGLSDAISKVFS